MGQEGRFLDNLFHDIPWYPGSNTPDGRIVGEMHRGRMDAENFHKQSLALQERALERLADAHNGYTTIEKTDFKPDQTIGVLQDMANEMQNMYSSQCRNEAGLSHLAEIESEGLSTLHGDFGQLIGPRPSTEELEDLIVDEEGFTNCLIAYSKGLLNTNAKDGFHNAFVRRFSKFTKRSEYVISSVEQKLRMQGRSLRTEHAIEKALKLLKYPLSILVQERSAIKSDLEVLAGLSDELQEPFLLNFVISVEDFFEQFRIAQATALPEETLIRLGKSNLLTSSAQNQVLKYYPETRDRASLTTVNYNLMDIMRGTRTGIRQRNIQINQGYEGINQGYEGIGQRKHLIQQGEMANHRLSSIVNNLAGVQGSIIDLESIVSDFAEMAGRSFDEINRSINNGFGRMDERLADIQVGMVLTRIAVISELEKLNATAIEIGRGVISSIARTNELLGNLVMLNRRSQQNLAVQRFEDGTECLKTAINRQNVQDAYDSFCDGIQAYRAGVENYFGSALCAELLGQLKEAYDRYSTTISRCDEKNRELKSQAQEGAGRVKYKMGDLPTAISQSKSAVDANPQNSPAKYQYAKYLYLHGLRKLAIKVLIELIQQGHEWYLKYRSDDAFQELNEEDLGVKSRGMDEDELIQLQDDLINYSGAKSTDIKLTILEDQMTTGAKSTTTKSTILEDQMTTGAKSTTTKSTILEDQMTTGAKSTTTTTLMMIVEKDPRRLMYEKFWLNPGYNKIQAEFTRKFKEYLDANLILLTAEACYDLALLACCLNFDKNLIQEILQTGVSQDPAMYRKHVNRTRILGEKLITLNPELAQKIQALLIHINLPNI